MSRTLHIADNFFPKARALRAEFDAKFADPRRATQARFVWDFWHIPDQYTALRTPAWTYFSPPLYQAWHAALVHWGRRVLGCHDISPPWLSNYVAGCGQQLHGDLPHGPWAFVFSLTDWQRRQFTGGETMLLADSVLDFWHDFQSIRSLEQPQLVTKIPAKFNRLVVFDPRVPHGVADVAGTMDPRAGRLVLHGWFVSPRPFIEGPLQNASGARAVSDAIDSLNDVVAAHASNVPMAGLLSLGIAIAPSGEVAKVSVLSDTTRVPQADEPARQQATAAFRRAIRAWQLPRRAAASRITLPLVFER